MAQYLVQCFFSQSPDYATNNNNAWVKVTAPNEQTARVDAIEALYDMAARSGCLRQDQVNHVNPRTVLLIENN